MPAPGQPLKNEDGSWSHPALPGLSFRLKREAQAAAEQAATAEPLYIHVETPTPDPPAPAETLTYIPRF